MATIRRIMHATDFSPASAPAFGWAIEIAKTRKAQLLIVHVISPPMPMPDGYVSPQVFETLESSSREYGQKQLDALLAKARKAGLKATGLLREGPVHDGIAEAARSQKVDMLVIGTHGRTGIAKLFIGSVAARMVSIAPCPVLTVRAK